MVKYYVKILFLKCNNHKNENTSENDCIKKTKSNERQSKGNAKETQRKRK
jgi:hypothetical protein